MGGVICPSMNGKAVILSVVSSGFSPSLELVNVMLMASV